MKLDSLMKRTMNRPLPAGRVSRLHALAFAVATGTAGVALLAHQARQNPSSVASSSPYSPCCRCPRCPSSLRASACVYEYLITLLRMMPCVPLPSLPYL